jgi:putative oligomerization/nucleic acid binding protein
MPSDPGPAVPGWFIGVLVLAILVGVSTTAWRIWLARKVASDAGLDPNTAAAVTMLSRDGVDATYLASTLATPARTPAPAAAERAKTAEERLRELQALKDKGLVSSDEYETQRQKILGSI